MAGNKTLTAQEEWNNLKIAGEQNPPLDKLMQMVGLEEVKREFLNIRAVVATAKIHRRSLNEERFNTIFLGNPGTGKTTIAKLFSDFLQYLDVYGFGLQWHFLEITGALLASKGVDGCEKLLKKIPGGNGGVFFIDEAYQLVSKNNPQGSSVLDYLLGEMEKLKGRVVFAFAGYKTDMEAFFAYNEGIRSRMPFVFNFKDYDEDQLLAILKSQLQAKYGASMKIQEISGRSSDFLLRLVARRISRSRDTPGFGNARTVENTLSQINRQFSGRLERENQAHSRRESKTLPDYFYLTEEDMLGPRNTAGLRDNKAWTELQAMTGLEKVKKTVSSLIELIQVNRQRELQDLAPLECNLNRVFLGNPGTGKTTVAKLYGQILVDLGMLSNGEVIVKNPSDFIGSALGGSQANTKQILEATKGKVLVIDEAYMLNQNTSKNGATDHVDPYKSDVIGTLVAEVQGKAGDDRCVLLLGYKDKMEDMFRESNEGLQRRFQLQDAFDFEDFTADQMREIWRSKTKQLGIECEPGVEEVVMEIIERQRHKMNFGNAGEVDNLLESAKTRCLQRRLQGTQNHGTPSTVNLSNASQYSFIGDVRLAKSDIDPEFDRLIQAGRDIDGLFKETIGCDQIKEKIKGYSKSAQSCKETDWEVRNIIPMTFIFKGPPGTGKTSTARNIGSVFYSLGILGCRDVVEVSSNDLLGQYVGQTVPKVKKQMEAALGKVLFIDEAYRLSASHFGSEALEEIITCLTLPKFEKKLVVILAGYSDKMEELMEVNAGLRSRFTEVLEFPSLGVEDSLLLLRKHLIQKCWFSPDYTRWKGQITLAMQYLVSSPDWANGRDIKSLSQKIHNAAMIAHGSGPRVTIRLQTMLKEMKSMMIERAQVLSFNRVVHQRRLFPEQVRTASNTPVKTSTSTKTTLGPSKRKREYFDLSQSDGKKLKLDTNTMDTKTSAKDWKKLQDKKNEEKKRDNEEKRQEEKRRQAERKRQEENKRRGELQRQEELQRQKEYQELQQKRENEKAQERIRMMGQCPVGWPWKKEGNGWRCEGGHHFMTDEKLGL